MGSLSTTRREILLKEELVGKGNEPGNPSEKESKRDSMAGLCVKVGDDLRDFSDSPTD